ncbi:sialidase [Arthrobacter sp. MYb229]|uniref:exo-alpha-sialidase n=1 Tax=unclassified Arthrobacter TaxID=235627 RepID=UPI000CFAB5D2|nr:MULTISPECIES: exo-alpha-sialidase [unclassified Arthrobacter]PRA06827.1 sialidase [Arthrobacter sp. MYb229]PRB53729.1 sialidase [Arthrobacter sp. MYb216]
MRIYSKNHRSKTLAAAFAAALILPLAWAPGAQAASTVAEADPQTPPGSYSELNLGADRTAENFFYRIPALAHLGNGVVISSWDARPGSAADAPNANSIVQRRSTDNGATWGPLSTIAAGFSGSAADGKYGYSDPSYVVDRESGKVFAFFVYSKDQGFHGSTWGNDDSNRNVLSAAVVHSTDAGLTWSEPRLITDVVKPGDSAVPGAVRGTFATSGAGIQVARGPYAGRLIQQYAGDVMQPDGSRSIQAYSIYSDDHGKTWQRGEFTGHSMDENKVVELSDGRIMLNSRDSAGGGYRKVAISHDGGHSYSKVEQDKNLPDPTNNAHVTQMHPNAEANSAEAKKLLYTGSNSQTARENVSARVSCDDGKTWPGLRTIRRGFSAYSVATALDKGQFGVFFEASYTNNMQFASFDEQWLNYVCAPLSADGFSAAAGSTQDVEVTITNQESEPLSGSVQLASSDNFSAAPVEVENLPAGETTTVALPVDIAAVANGRQNLQLQFTTASGKTSQAVVETAIAGREVTGIEVTGKRGDAERDPAADPYQVGEKLPYHFLVKNTGNINQWVVPTEGNFSPFAAKPVGEPSPSGNCRYSNLAAGKSYACTTPAHEVTADDLADGFFVPATHWTSGRLNEFDAIVDDYQITGDEVDLLERNPGLSISVAEPEFVDKDDDGYASLGDVVAYELTVSNEGNVRLKDLQWAGNDLSALEAGQSQTASATRKLSASDIEAGTLDASTEVSTAKNGLRQVEAQYTLAATQLPQAPQDSETSQPARAVLSHDNGHDTGLKDGDYTVSMNLWWGANASRFVLLEDGVEISRQELESNSPAAQQATVDVAGKPNGVYVYQAMLTNAAGTTRTEELEVEVTDTNPTTGVLSGSAAKTGGRVNLETNMWWGTNASGYRLYENGVLVDEQELTVATPAAQKAVTTLSQRAPGTYQYQAVLGNKVGETKTKIIQVKVR